MTARPNILFINTDQQAWDAVSGGGNPYLATPNLDRLRTQGLSFDRSYCTDPVCSPARASWMTGRYTSEAGVPSNGGWLHDDIPDLGQILTAAGYDACHAGKWHVPGRDVRESFRTLYFGKDAIGAGGADYYDPATTHAVLDFLAHHDPSQPFFLHVGYVNPHDICEFLHDHEHKSPPDPVESGLVVESDLPPLPASFSYDERETVVQRVFRRGSGPLIHPGIQQGVRDWDNRRWRYLLWNLYRFTEQVDQEIGLVLDALAASPMRDNTLILFSVDHGESAGRHHTFQKFTPYEESIRVPLVIASLGERLAVPKGTEDREHLVSGVDLLPTVCDYAGASVPPGCRGASLRPLVEGRNVPWRDAVYVESNVWGRVWVGPRWKYVAEYIPNDPEEPVPPRPDTHIRGLEQFFDLDHDPDERFNLADEPAHAPAVMRCRADLEGFERTLSSRRFNSGCGLCRHGLFDQWAVAVRTYWREHPELGRLQPGHGTGQ